MSHLRVALVVLCIAALAVVVKTSDEAVLAHDDAGNLHINTTGNTHVIINGLNLSALVDTVHGMRAELAAYSLSLDRDWNVPRGHTPSRIIAVGTSSPGTVAAFAFDGSIVSVLPAPTTVPYSVLVYNNTVLAAADNHSSVSFALSQGVWTQALPKNPHAPIFVGSAVIAWGDLIYSIGGVLNGNPVSHVSVYSPAAQSWLHSDWLTEGVYWSAAVVFGKDEERLFVIGGKLAFGASRGAFIYDRVAWRTAVIMPNGRYGHSIVKNDDAIFIVGGIVVQASASDIPPNVIYRYDGRVLTEFAPNPPAAFDVATALLGGALYAFGGRVNATSPAQNTVWKLVGQTWVNVAALSTAFTGRAVSL